jgi:hemerythrin-like domain-containing protein
MAKGRSKGVEAIEMLQRDHDRVEKAFREFEKMGHQDAAACRRLIESVCDELRRHTVLEEEIFYPALREAIGDEEVMNEAAVEHETCAMLIEQLENMGDDDPNYHATFKVLGEYVRHHVREEENEMFPAARRAGLEFEALGACMRERRQELAAGAPARGEPVGPRGPVAAKPRQAGAADNSSVRGR